VSILYLFLRHIGRVAIRSFFEGDEMKIKWIQLVMLAGICSSFAWAKTSERVLFSFNQADGSTPDAGLVADKQGNLYGTTFDGGPNGMGNVFELSPTKATAGRKPYCTTSRDRMARVP
jgi:uncharacterized repeat protein (TIGR03803 family)